MTLDANGFDQIGYDALMTAALRGVMREALRKVEAEQALPGQHHFYITYRTDMPGVVMADVLKDRFPEEITIVIQHQFWDLEVHADAFEVVLKFGGVPQHLYVPFAAVTRFADPSVNLLLPFENAEDDISVLDLAEEETAAEDAPAEAETSGAAASGDTVVSLDAFRRK